MRGARIYLIAHSYAVDMVHPEYVAYIWMVVDILVQNSEKRMFPGMLENVFQPCNISSRSYRKDGKRNMPRSKRHEYASVERRCTLVCSFTVYSQNTFYFHPFCVKQTSNSREYHNVKKHQNDGNQ